MGKSKTLIWISVGFLVLLLLLVWRLSLPRLEKSRINDWLKKFDLKIQAEEWDVSNFGQRLTLKNVLLVASEIVEYPLLSAESIQYTSQFSTLELTRPKIMWVTKENASFRLQTLFAELLNQGMRVKIEEGEIQLWKDQAFTGIPFQLRELQIAGKGGATKKLSVSFKVPGGFSSLKSFAPSSRFFSRDPFFVSAEANYSSLRKGRLKNIQWDGAQGSFFQAKELKWEHNPNLNLKISEPRFEVEYTHAGRWRICGQVVNSLMALKEELFAPRRLSDLELQSTGGTVQLIDKYVFPLFSEALEDVDIFIRPRWLWQGKGKLKGGSVDATGGFLEEWFIDKVTFENLPLDSFFSYYHRELPYEGLKGVFSGTLLNEKLDLTFKQVSGTVKAKDEDLLAQEVGLPSPLVFAFLQKDLGELQVEVPFKRDWVKSLAPVLVERLKKELEGFAIVETKGGKINFLSWIPVQFRPGKTDLRDSEQKRLKRLVQWMAFLPEGILEIQANKGTDWGSTPLSQNWVVTLDKEGFRYLSPVKVKEEELPPTLEKMAAKRIDTVQKFLLQNKKIKAAQIQILPLTELTQDTVSYRLLLPEAK